MVVAANSPPWVGLVVNGGGQPTGEGDKENDVKRTRVYQYMMANITDHVDPLTGEVSATGLAEDACWAIEPDRQDIPEVYFELAETLATRHEVQTGVRPPNLHGSLGGLINSLPSDWF